MLYGPDQLVIELLLLQQAKSGFAVGSTVPHAVAYDAGRQHWQCLCCNHLLAQSEACAAAYSDHKDIDSISWQVAVMSRSLQCVVGSKALLLLQMFMLLLLYYIDCQ